MQLDETMNKPRLTRTEYHTLKKAKMKQASVSKLKKDVGSVVLATAILTTATTTSAASLTEYTVNQKDSLYKLAKQFGVSVEYLQKINEKQDDMLLIGEKILVPQTNEKQDDMLLIDEKILVPQTNEINNTYTERVVKAGDTWYQFSKEVNVPVKELLKINNKTSDLLLVNETILLPSVQSNTQDTIQTVKKDEKQKIEVTRVVEKGETLWKIAREYRTTVDELRAANNLKNNKIKIGQVLTIRDITQATVVIGGVADSNFVEFKQPNKESIVLKVTPFHSVEQFINRTGAEITIQYNEETNELISFEVK